MQAVEILVTPINRNCGGHSRIKLFTEIHWFRQYLSIARPLKRPNRPKLWRPQFSFRNNIYLMKSTPIEWPKNIWNWFPRDCNRRLFSLPSTNSKESDVMHNYLHQILTFSNTENL